MLANICYILTHFINIALDTDLMPESESIEALMYEATSLSRHAGAKLPFMIEHVDGVFLLLLFSFMFFAHIYHGGLDFIVNNYKILFKGSSNSREFRQTTTHDVVFSYFLLFQCALLLAIVCYDVLMHNNPLATSTETPFVTILLITLFICFYLLFKVGIYRLVGYIFDTASEMKLWAKSYLVIFEILGVLLFLPTLLLVYADYGHIYLVIFVFSLLTIAHLIYFYRRLYFFIAQKFNFLYLIAYLCTVEILPCVFLVLGINFIYRIDVLELLWLIK